jgi:hypothetical protein
MINITTEIRNSIQYIFTVWTNLNQASSLYKVITSLTDTTSIPWLKTYIFLESQTMSNLTKLLSKIINIQN